MPLSSATPKLSGYRTRTQMSQFDQALPDKLERLLHTIHPQAAASLMIERV